MATCEKCWGEAYLLAYGGNYEYLDPLGLGLDNYIDGNDPNQSNLFINECEGMCGI